MAATTDTTTPPPEDQFAQLQRYVEMIQGRQQAYAPPAPVDRSIVSLLGEAVGGGTTGLSPAEREDAGRRALLNFGANLSAASGYSTMPRTFGQVFAQGVGGAQQSLAGSEAVGAARLGAQQAYEEKQQELRLAALKEAIPLLQIEQTERTRRGLLGGATPPSGTSIATAGSYEGDIGTLEGTGRNTRSTAAGVGQFIEPTWGAFVAANPELFKGMSPEQILAARDKPEIANKAITWLAQQNAPALAKAGVAPSGPSLALAHRLGPAAAAAVMQAPDNAPVADVLVASIGKDQAAAYIKANPDLGTATAGDLKKKYAGVHAPGFLAPPAADATPGAPAPAPTATAPPAATLAPVRVAGPGAPTGTTSMATDEAPAAEALPLADAMAKAKATGQPVLFQGGNGAAVKPDGTINMPTAAPATPAQQPAVARVPDTFTPRPVPIPPEVQQRIDHPETPEITQAYRTQIGSASGPDAGKQMQEAQTVKEAAVAKVKADAIAQAQTIRERGEAQQIEEWKVRRAEQRAIDAAEASRQQERDIKTQEGQQAIELAKVQAGQTYHQKLEEQAATSAQENTIKPMSAAALKAHQMNLGLSQMLPLLPDLPKGGGLVGSVLTDHPDLAPLLNIAGVLNDKQADAVRLINGLVANISTEMKPAGLGALREYEWDAFKSQLPNLLSTPAGQQKAVALLMNMNNRIQQEASWMGNYFSRKIPDETTPGRTRSAHNLENDNPSESIQQRMDRDLGPIIPSFSGTLTGNNQAQWEQSLPPGKPYYKTWARPDPQKPGQPLRDQRGNVMTTKTLEVRPWE